MTLSTAALRSRRSATPRGGGGGETSTSVSVAFLRPRPPTALLHTYLNKTSHCAASAPLARASRYVSNWRNPGTHTISRPPRPGDQHASRAQGHAADVSACEASPDIAARACLYLSLETTLAACSRDRASGVEARRGRAPHRRGRASNTAVAKGPQTPRSLKVRAFRVRWKGMCTLRRRTATIVSTRASSRASKTGKSVATHSTSVRYLGRARHT